MKKHISLTIDVETYERFRQKCNKDGSKMSSRIEVLILGDLDADVSNMWKDAD